MNILIFNTFYFPKRVGGAEISVQHLAERLAASGHKVWVITSGATKSVKHLNGVGIIRIKQKNIFSTFNKNSANALSKIIWHLLDSCNPMHYFQISRLLKRIRPDVVHTNNIQGFSPFIWAIVKWRRLRLVHTIRDYYLLCHRNTLYHNESSCDSLCWQCRLTYRIKKNFTRYPDCFVGISEFVLDEHARHLPLPAFRKQVIYNTVGPFQEVITRRQRNDQELVFGFLGRISQAKGAFYLARELAAIDPSLQGRFRFIFAGSAHPDHEEIIVSIQNTLRNVRVEFPGYVDAASFYRQIDVLVVPSLWHEPFGRIVVESISNEVPVCVARTGGLKEFQGLECTWSFDPVPGALRDLLEAIIKNPGDICSKKKYCRQDVRSFAPEHHDRQYLKLYAAKESVS